MRVPAALIAGLQLLRVVEWVSWVREQTRSAGGGRFAPKTRAPEALTITTAMRNKAHQRPPSRRACPLPPLAGRLPALPLASSPGAYTP